MDETMSNTMTMTPPETEETEETETQPSRAIPRQRRRLKKGETYQPNYAGLASIVPDGILTKVQAIVGTEQKGSKTALRLLRSLEFHQGMQEEHDKVVKYHLELNDRLLEKLAMHVGDSTGNTAQVIEFLHGLPDGVLESIAASKGIPLDRSRAQIITALTATVDDTPVVAEPAVAEPAEPAEPSV